MQAIINVLNSLVGFLLAVLIVVGAAVIVGYNAVRVQKSTATSFYSIDTESLRMKDSSNHNAIKLLDNANNANLESKGE